MNDTDVYILSTYETECSIFFLPKYRRRKISSIEPAVPKKYIELDRGSLLMFAML